MAYPKEKIDEVLAYLDEGHSARDAERRFGVSRESAARWRRGRDGNLEVGRPRPVKYPFETVRLALGLAYGGHGLRLDEVAVMLGVSAPTISNWKKRYVEGAAMDIPEIDPDEIVHLGRKEMDEMSDEELRRYVHELEVKAYVLEGTVKVLKAGGVEGLGNEEKAALIDARPRNITATELFGALGIPSSSYYYLRSRPERADAYAGARAAIREEFELVRGSRGYRYIRQRLREREDPIRISGKKVRELMAEEGCVVTYARKRRGYNSYKGEIGGPGEPRRARLPRRRPQQALAHRRDAVPDPGRQGVPESRDRLLRRDAGRLDDKGAARRRDGQHDARGGVRNARAGRGPRDPQRPGVPLQVARVARDLREARPRALDVEEGVLAGQLGHGGVLRPAQERVLLRPGLGGRQPGGFRIPARRLHEILPLREDQEVPRMDEPQSVQEIAGPGRLASPVNGAHPRDKINLSTFCHISRAWRRPGSDPR